MTWSIISLIKANRKSALAVTMINIPLSLALAIASGATPVQWLLTAFWAGLLASIFCSSHHNIYGPAWSLAWILLPVAVVYGIAYLPILAIGWGLIILLIAVLRLSKYIVLIPMSALQGFLLWIGLIIGLQQIPAALWLDLWFGLLETFQNVWSVSLIALWVFIVSFIILQLCRKYTPSVPGAIVVTIIWAIAGKLLVWWGDPLLPLLSDVYTDVAFNLIQIPTVATFTSIFQDWELLKTLIIASWWVAVIAVLETLISSKMAYKETRVWYDAQREVYGLWITNLLSWIVWSLPSSALVPRTTMNMQTWASHRMSGWLVSVFTAIVALFLFEWRLAYLPFAVTAAILIDVAIGMINLSLYHKMRSLQKSSIAIILFVWVLSYLWDPMLWILVGTIMALLTVVNRAMKADLVVNVFRDGHHVRKLPLAEYQAIQGDKDLIIIKLEGELSYLTIDTHSSAMQTVTAPSTIILWFGYTSTLDIDAMEELTLQIQTRLTAWTDVYITWLTQQPHRMLSMNWVFHHLEENGFVRASKSELLDELLEHNT